jgi:hypothetical protein
MSVGVLLVLLLAGRQPVPATSPIHVAAVKG